MWLACVAFFFYVFLLDGPGLQQMKKCLWRQEIATKGEVISPFN